MKSTSRFAGSVAAIFVVAALTGCASWTKPQSASATSAEGSADAKMSTMDMEAMCDKHKKMMSAAPEDRKMMMDENMKTMSPEKMQEHMAMMQAKCK
jgi:hypothetical protein